MDSSSSESNLNTTKAIITTIGSVVATAVVIRSITQDLLPHEIHNYISSNIRNFLNKFSNQLTFVIDEFDGLVTNEIYSSAVTYLGTKISPTTSRLKISKPEKEKNFSITMDRNEEVIDIYKGQKFRWLWICTKTEAKDFYNPNDMNSTLKSEVRSFELKFHYKNRELAVNSYLPYITNEAKKKKQEKKTIQLFTVDYENMYNINDMWISVTLDHPSTFETLAMDSEQKDMILNDLKRFVMRKDYYKKVGKAWKRGYLLYGPPGTGKSSLIAAMANYLNFDVYDLELSELQKNSELKKLLLGTGNKSILVVEDIDCSVDSDDKLVINRDDPDRENLLQFRRQKREQSKVTLSGLLNFVDGLWSSCGDERIIIFTTNHVEKLDPALLRPGRMDVHINMSYCTISGFRLLASNYLGIEDHVMFKEIEDFIEEAKVTPAEVAEQLLKNDEPKVSLQGLIDFIHKKVEENKETINT